eukprot:jgi/Ulvmu1/1970/UM012_0132.1
MTATARPASLTGPCRIAPFRVRQPAVLSAAHSLVVEGQYVRSSVQCQAIGSIISTEWNDDDYVEVGTLGRAHGIKGEVIVGLSTSSPDERFGRPGKRYIQAPPAQGAFVTRQAEPPREVHLTGGRKHITKGNQVWLLRFEECPDRDTAETLRNYRVLIHKNDREALTDSDEFYSNDLVGLTVAMVAHHPSVSDVGDSGHSSDGADTSADEAANDGSAAHAAPVSPLDSAGNGAGSCRRDGEGAEPAAGSGEGGASGSEREGEWEEEEEEVVVALGRVVDVYDGTGTHGVLRIEFREGLRLQPDGQLVEVPEEERCATEGSDAVATTKATGLLPFARDIVPEVDLEEQLIVVDPPEGWLELYLTPKEKKKRRFRKRRSPKPLPVAIEA